MVVQLMDRIAGTPVYVNPTYVVSLRPEPTQLDRASIVKLQDGETIHVNGEHAEVAEKLARSR